MPPAAPRPPRGSCPVAPPAGPAPTAPATSTSEYEPTNNPTPPAASGSSHPPSPNQTIMFGKRKPSYSRSGLWPNRPGRSMLRFRQRIRTHHAAADRQGQDQRRTTQQCGLMGRHVPSISHSDTNLLNGCVHAGRPNPRHSPPVHTASGGRAARAAGREGPTANRFRFGSAKARRPVSCGTTLKPFGQAPAFGGGVDDAGAVVGAVDVPTAPAADEGEAVDPLEARSTTTTGTGDPSARDRPTFPEAL